MYLAGHLYSALKCSGDSAQHSIIATTDKSLFSSVEIHQACCQTSHLLQALLLPVCVWRMTGSKEAERTVQATDTAKRPDSKLSEPDSRYDRTVLTTSGATSGKHALIPVLRHQEDPPHA